MTDLLDWIEHRMRLLEIEGPAALAELADLGPDACASLWEERRLAPLQQSQRRRLAWALQTNLRNLYALDEGTIEWIEDSDRYLAHAAVLPEEAKGWGTDGSSGWYPGRDSRDGGASSGEGYGAPAMEVIGSATEPPLGTPVLGRVRWGGRIDPDECWDEQWGRRLPDGQAQRPDTYALETELAGQFVVVRNAAPWEARQGAVVALYISDGFEGVGYFGQLVRGAGGCWRMRPCHAGQSSGLAGGVGAAPGASTNPVEGHGEGHAAVILAPDQVQRIGRLVRRWPDLDRRGRW